MKKLLVAVLAVTALAVSSSAAAAPDRGPAAFERFLVGFTSTPGAAERALVARHGGAVRHAFPEIAVLAVELEASSVSTFARERGVAYVEKDEPRYPLGLADAQLTPSTGNGLYGLVTTRSTTAHANGHSGLGVTACVVDTGVDYTHSDIAANYVGGIDYVSDDNDPWWNNPGSLETHGTHVAGTVLGAYNTSGVYGVAFDAKLLHARVLQNSGGSTSDVMAGADWCRDNGAKVINMSLGGGAKSRSEENLYKNIDASGVLIVAAAGNDGQNKLSYPAAYASVVSVAAVDVNNRIASFSNTGRGLDLSGPGVLVLSSVPPNMGSESSVSADVTYRAFGLEYAGKTDAAGVTATIVNCGTGNTASEIPAEANGNICLMQRGTESFATKVTNAQNGGAIGAIIYNNVDGDFVGTLGSEGSWIPAVSVSKANGEALVAAVGGSGTVVNMSSAWDHFDGTSMATPHVAGVAALAFASHAGWSDENVEDRLKATAQDLGVAGYDTTYGYGLVNADGATAP